MTTINRDSLRIFLRKVVESEYADSLEVFDFEAESLIADVLAGKDILKADDAEPSSAFGEPVETVLGFVKLILGTVKVVLELRKMAAEGSKSVEEAESRNARWKSYLVEQGIEEEKAMAIVEKFSADLPV